MSELKNEGVTRAPKAANTVETLTPKSVEVVAAQLTQEAFDEKMAALKMEAAELEVKMNRANLQDMQERLAEREMKRENVGQRAKINGSTIATLARNRHLTQERCNHHKGGNGANGVVAGQGDDSQYAIMKHKMANSDIWIRCLRCGKWWTPPVQEHFETMEGYLGAVAEYQAALNFQTRNVMSGSIAFNWGDGGKYYREVTRHTTNT